MAEICVFSRDKVVRNKNLTPAKFIPSLLYPYLPRHSVVRHLFLSFINNHHFLLHQHFWFEKVFTKISGALRAEKHTARAGSPNKGESRGGFGQVGVAGGGDETRFHHANGIE